MDLEHILQYFENKTILITGVTGFLAKVFIEKLLRVQPKIKKLYLLIRAADTTSAASRLQNEVLGKDLFRVLKELWGSDFDSFSSEKLVAVSGNVSETNFGIKDANLIEEMWKEINIIFNSAATTSFDERYDVAFATNTTGALHALNFAKKCAALELFLHISTVYVCGEREGVIVESPVYQSDLVTGKHVLNINTEKNLIKGHLTELEIEKPTKETTSSAMKELGSARAKLHGWPNTYVFTKAMGEMLIEEFRGGVPLVICRPAMVTSTYKEPFPGWIEGVRTIDGVIVAYGKGKLRCLPVKKSTIFDLIPADMVINSTIIAIAVHANKPSNTIYHVSSSHRNPVYYTTIYKCTHHYFKTSPLLDHKGNPIKPATPRIVETIPEFHKYMAAHYGLPLKAFHLINIIIFQYYKEKYTKLNKMFKLSMRFVDLYQPYLFFKGIFDDSNLEKLRMVAKETRGDLFNFEFDTASINWENYLTNIHIPGLVKYVIK